MRDQAKRSVATPFGVRIDKGRILTQTRDGVPMLVTNSDLSVLGNLVSFGALDGPFRAFLRRRLSGSDVYVDVGANIGHLTVDAGRYQSRYGRVFAFEPNPAAFRLLRDNTYLNRSNGITGAEYHVRELALSDAAGAATLYIPSHHAGMASLEATAVGQEDDRPCEAVEVRTSTLDAECGHLSHIRVLKIDVEGSEDRVLKGALGLSFSGRVDFVDLEWIRSNQGPAGETLLTLLGEFAQRGATSNRLDPDGGLVTLGQPATVSLRYMDLMHLVLDLRPLREGS